VSDVVEWCRECRDEEVEIQPAEFILWGKLFPPEAMGPKCWDHAAKYIHSMYRIDQYAVFDLRKVQRRKVAS